MPVTYCRPGDGPGRAVGRLCLSGRSARAMAGLAGCVAGLLVGMFAPAAASAAITKIVSYHGYRMVVPAGWPVYHVSSGSTVCVRFDRHAVYLGDPGTNQDCPGQAAGRTEAILVAPLDQRAVTRAAVSAPGLERPLAIPTLAAAEASSGSVARLLNRTLGIVVTATWGRDPAVIRRALGIRSLGALAAASRVRPAPARIETVRAHKAGVTTATALPGAVFDGPGFDACSTPSASVMSAWAGSSFGAVGIYIGGVNEACSQPNLSAAWVSSESTAGWHLVPIYVGLQAPSNSCGCAAISNDPAAEGTAAADDAVTQAQALGIGAGNPIYFDMEAYTPSTTTSSAVLAFLAAWTHELHAAGYLSGVYSSEDSGVEDLVSRYGSGYAEPDDIWFADWNGEATVSEVGLPATEWASAQRLHQYEGGHNATHGGATLNIDSDELDGQTAAAGNAVPATAPTASEPPTITGTPLAGQTLTDEHAPWTGNPTSYSYQWELCDASGANCTPIPGATVQSYTLTAGDTGQTLRVLEGAANAIGAGATVSSAATAAVHNSASGYWLFTASGNVYSSLYEPSFGSPATAGVHSSPIVGMAVTPGARGYRLVTRWGTVYSYGSATPRPTIHPAHPVEGIVAGPSGSYWLYTSRGNVYASKGAGSYGSPATQHPANPITGMSATPTGRGYWLVTSTGTVFAYGHAASLPRIHRAGSIEGIVTDPLGGYWLYTATGDVYPSRGAAAYGSPATAGLHLSTVTGMLATPDGKGYWLTTSAGTVYPYGDAAAYPDPTPVHLIKGLAGQT